MKMTREEIKELGLGIGRLMRKTVDESAAKADAKANATIAVLNALARRVEALERAVAVARARQLGRAIVPTQAKIARPKIKAKIARQSE